MTSVISILKPSSSHFYVSSEKKSKNKYGNDEVDNRMSVDSEDEFEEENQKEIKQEGKINNTAVITPGEVVTEETTWMRGHGTYSTAYSTATYASVVGYISRVNKLLTVVPLSGKYTPAIGDHIIGRIVEVSHRRWKVDIGARQLAVLQLGSINLPGGVLRRKSEADELQMRSLLKEGDLLNAEVQALFVGDGAAALHTRSLRYGKLRNGFLVKVPARLVSRSKTHLFTLPGSVEMTLGVNGFIWLSKHIINSKSSTSNINTPSITRLEQESTWTIYSDLNDNNISNQVRENIARYSNCLSALVDANIPISQTSLVATYENSLAYDTPGALLDPVVRASIVVGAGV